VIRPSEWIHLIVFSFFAALAWLRRLPDARRAKATGIAALGLAITLSSAFLLPNLLRPETAPAIRDWLPAALILLVYWQTGQFFVRIDKRFEQWLERSDEWMAGPILRLLSKADSGPGIAAALELAYLFCYPMVPMSFGALYALGLERHADRFWTVVLVSSYLAYGVLPFVQTAPPRMLAEPWLVPLPHTRLRSFNLWILRHGSIHANTFPSAHVSASAACALVLLAVTPWPVGLAFAMIALGIAAGTVAGRYHFAWDAIAGVALAAVIFFAVTWLGRR
jgi:membrane-associated phospholipid phosphatase